MRWEDVRMRFLRGRSGARRMWTRFGLGVLVGTMSGGGGEGDTGWEECVGWGYEGYVEV